MGARKLRFVAKNTRHWQLKAFVRLLVLAALPHKQSSHAMNFSRKPDYKISTNMNDGN